MKKLLVSFVVAMFVMSGCAFLSNPSKVEMVVEKLVNAQQQLSDLEKTVASIGDLIVSLRASGTVKESTLAEWAGKLESVNGDSVKARLLISDMITYLENSKPPL